MANTLDRAPLEVRPPRAAAPRPARRRSRRRVVAATGVAAAVVAAALAVSLGRGSSPALETFAVPAAYHVTYSVTTPGAAQSAEQLWVRRPFDGVDITYAGPPPGATPSLVVVYRLGVQVLQASNAEAGALRVPAAVAPQDIRPDVVIPAGLHAGRLKLIGTRHVLGRRCEVFRSASSLRAGALPALTSGSTYVDTCIDADGIVLRETQHAGGHVTTDRRAVSVQIGDDAVASGPFGLTGKATPFDSGGGAFTALTLTSRPPGGSWALGRPPVGFAHVGRYAVVPPQPQLFGQGGDGFGSMGLPGALVTEMDDVFVRGSDAIVLQQGSAINGAAFSPPANSQPVDLGSLGQGQLLVSGNTVVVAAEPGNGKRFVRLSGTLSPDQMLALMRSLVAQPSGTLTRLAAGSR